MQILWRIKLYLPDRGHHKIATRTLLHIDQTSWDYFLFLILFLKTNYKFVIYTALFRKNKFIKILNRFEVCLIYLFKDFTLEDLMPVIQLI